MRLGDAAYESIKMDIADLLEDYGITAYPLDVFALAERMGIKVKSYDEYGRDSKIALSAAFQDGVSFFNEKDGFFYILYNPDIGRRRIRFTIAHEIGHIRLGHTKSTTWNESEVDFYGGLLLAPVILVDRYGFRSAWQISEFFDISLECAGYALNRLRVKKSWGYGYKEYELRIAEMIQIDMAACAAGG